MGLRLTRCVEEIEIWMSSNRLRLNVSKTEFLWLGSPRRLDGNTGSIQITNSVIAPSKTVRCLGVVVDPAMTSQEHVAGLVRVCYYHLRQLRYIRRSLSVDSCHALVRALILSRIDYCNELQISWCCRSRTYRVDCIACVLGMFRIICIMCM